MPGSAYCAYRRTALASRTPATQATSVRSRIPAGSLSLMAAALAGILLGVAPAMAQTAPQEGTPDASALAEKVQNPVAGLVTMPFQNNTNFHAGPHAGTQDVLNFEPVIPFHISPDWNIITRTIVPLTWSPSMQPAESVPFGLSPATFTAFLSPSAAVDGWLWGAGPIVQVPTISNKTLGSNVWGLGPSAVVVRTVHPWVVGTLVNNVFSMGGTDGRGATRYSLLTVQPFVNYNFDGGWFVGSAPIVNAEWTASGDKWTVPIGVQGGRLVMLGGKLPVNLLIGAYYNAVRPQYGPTWQLRTQVAFIF